MDESKGCFETFVHQMSEMVLHLLSPLNVSKFTSYPCQKVYFFVFYFLLTIDLLDFETHVAANSSNTSIVICSWIFVEVAIHFH